MKFLEQMTRDFPMIAPDATSALVAMMEKMSVAGDETSQQNAYESFKALLAVLNEDYSANAENESLLAAQKDRDADTAAFKEALSAELTKREVPEYFWRAALDIDDANAEYKTSADAIETQYKAYLQIQNDQKLSAMRPEDALRVKSHSAAVDAYIRSLRSDSPLAGKLKE